MNPRHILCDYIDGDEYLDLLIANSGEDSLSLLRGTGSGQFSPATAISVGTAPWCSAIGDLNGDSLPDVVSANHDSNDITILLNNGDGTYATSTLNFFIFNPTIHPSSVAIGDLNGDSNADLAIAGYDGDQNVSVMLGNGDGTFQLESRLWASGFPVQIRVVDVTNDDVLDLIVLNETGNNVVVLAGAGNGFFSLPVRYGAGGNPRKFDLLDFNGDGLPDVADSNAITIVVRFGLVDGTFSEGEVYDSPGSPTGMALDDVNNDGRPDLIVSNYEYDSVSVRTGDGQGGFGEPIDFPTGAGQVFVATGDFDRDGLADIASLLTDSGQVMTLLNNGLSAAITQSPQSQTAISGDEVSLEVVATGTVSYQWRRDGIPLRNALPYSGVRTSALTISQVTASESGVYDVVVGAACHRGVASQPASLVVVQPTCVGDFNGDGVFNSGDIQLFISSLLLGNMCPS